MGSRWVSPLLVAGACVVGLLWTWLLAFHTGSGLRTDVWGYQHVTLRQSLELYRLANHTRELAEPRMFAALVAAVILIPLLRGRWIAAAAVLALIVAANLTTQILQTATEATRHVLQIPYAQWPSGHTTAIASVAFGLLLGVPSRARPVAAAAAIVITVVMGWAVIALRMHLPSDVAGALFVCGFWASLAIAALMARQSRAPAQASS